MIVKNERRVLARCLASVRAFIDHWVIVDTGSSDGTQQMVGECLAAIPGTLHERPWKNFGHNRTEALALARGCADNALVVDADEELRASPSFTAPALTADEYLVRCHLDGSDTSWYRLTLARLALDWRYEGVLHEILTTDQPHTTGRVEGLLIVSHSDGARNVDVKAKYEADARVLEEALAAEPNNARYVFYLAQSHRDAGDLERARQVYERRAAMGGWREEVWYAMFQVAELGRVLRRPWAETLAAYLRAHAVHPARAEPLCALAAHYRGTGEWPLADLFARAAAAIPRPDEILFVDESVYAWRARDEAAVAAFWMGRFAESAALSERLLADLRFPAAERARVTRNLVLARAKL
jgi:tetratricopeptide (TPR) repeat protein